MLDSKEASLKWVKLCDPNNDQDPVNFSFPEENLDSPLYYASLLGLTDVVKHYIAQGLHVDWCVDRGYGTPLVAACSHGHVQIVKSLLEAGADPTRSGNPFYGCPLAVVVEEDRAEIVQILMKQPSVHVDCIRCDILSRSVEEQSADGPNDRKLHKKHMESMVYIAVRYDSPESLDLLLSAGADTNIIEGDTLTALNAACGLGNEAAMNKLLANGSRVDNDGGCGATPLISACYLEGNLSIVRKLIDIGTNIDAKVVVLIGEKYTALYLASAVGSTDMVRLLLESNADPNIRGCSTYYNVLQVRNANFLWLMSR